MVITYIDRYKCINRCQLNYRFALIKRLLFKLYVYVVVAFPRLFVR